MLSCAESQTRRRVRGTKREERDEVRGGGRREGARAVETKIAVKTPLNPDRIGHGSKGQNRTGHSSVL